MDNEDMSRVLPAVYASNIAASLRRIQAWLTTQGGAGVSENDWAIWKMANDLLMEKNGRQ